jgi:L-fucose isomerase-like protein
VTDNFDCLSDKINAVRVVSKMKNTKILCLGPVHQHIGGKTLGIGNYEFIREAQEKLGVSVEFVSMDELIKEFDEMKTSKEMVGIYKEFLAHAREKTPDVKKDEALKAVKMYVVLKEFLKRKRADALTISCYQTNLIDRIGSAPCYAVARLNDEGITAGCEADFNALISMLIVSYASNKPVFMGDPIFNEKVPRIVNAHCLCPSRLKGYDKEEPYIATTHYESGRALTQQIVWEEGEQITGTLLSPDLKSMIIIRGKITNTNMGYPACRTQVEFEVDDIDEIWKQCGEHIPFIGHLVTVHGDHSKEIVEVCKIVGIETIVV